MRAAGVSRVRGRGGGVPEPEPGGRRPAGAALSTQPAALARPAPQPGSGSVFLKHFGSLYLITLAVNLHTFSGILFIIIYIRIQFNFIKILMGFLSCLFSKEE